MKGYSKLMNVRRISGGVQRIPRERADELVSGGKAVFISNTLFKAAKAGVTVTGKMSDAQIKKAIRAVKKPEPEPKSEPSNEDGDEQGKGSKKRKKRGSKKKSP